MRQILVSLDKRQCNRQAISDALMAMHSCEQTFELTQGNTPFIVDNDRKGTTISLDDSYIYYKEITDMFTDCLNRSSDRHIEEQERKRQPRKRVKRNFLDERLATIFKILDKQDNEVLFKEKGSTINISIRGRHSYNVDQMRKLCTLFVKFNPIFTCKDNHFVMTLNLN